MTGTATGITSHTDRAAIATIVISTLGIGIAYASAFSAGGAPRWAPWLFASGTTGAVVATITLGAIRPGRGLGPLVVPFALMTAMLAAGFAALFVLPDTGAAEPLLLGLPRRAAIVLYGIGLLPTLVLPVAYAVTFTGQTLRPEDLARVLETARASRRTADARATQEMEER